jgi:hypothetical protein
MPKPGEKSRKFCSRSCFLDDRYGRTRPANQAQGWLNEPTRWPDNPPSFSSEQFKRELRFESAAVLLATLRPFLIVSETADLRLHYEQKLRPVIGHLLTCY